MGGGLPSVPITREWSIDSAALSLPLADRHYRAWLAMLGLLTVARWCLL